MAQDFKRYFERAVGATPVDIPNGSDFDTNDTIIGISVANILGATINVDVYIKNSTNDYYLVKTAPIPSGGALQLLDGGAKMNVQSGDRMYVVSDTASSADVWVSTVDAISAQGGNLAYIGNTPALNYTTFSVQHFTTSATTGYTLDNAVTNENGIALFINNVRQQPGSSYAYTASGTTLTLSAATTTSDTMYCVFIGKAVQTVNPGAGSVGLSQLSATGTASSSTFLRGDNSWNASSGAVLTGSTNNTVTTVTAANAIQGEANLTYDGTFLGVGANADLGIGIHISNTDTGGSVATDANDLIVENSRSGMTFLSNNDNYGIINFADPQDDNIGQIAYLHTDNSLSFVVNDSTTLKMASDGRGISQYTAQVWVRYDQVADSVLDSYNVSSVDDDATGEFTVNFTNAMANANYCAVGMSEDDRVMTYGSAGKVPTTADVQLQCTHYNGSRYDENNNGVLVFGD